MSDPVVVDDSASNEELPLSAYTGSFGNGQGEKLETFTTDLRNAIDNSYPQDQYPYSTVHVLLLRWAEDDLHIQLESNFLRKVFDQQFHFQTEDWQIPSQNATRALQKKIYHFQDAHQSNSELLILYYAGRAETDLKYGRCIWKANQHKDAPSLDWSSIQHLLENAIPHVLIILDCCYVVRFTKGTVGKTTKELLAASGQNGSVIGPRCRTFTSLLIEKLQSFKTTPFTVAMLHSKLVTRQKELMFSPVHVLLSIPYGNSINLAPLFSGSLSNYSLDSGVIQPAADIPPHSLHDDLPDTRVLFAVPVVEKEVLGWVGWLTTHPPWDVTKIDVRVESVFENNLTIVLISVPVFVWNRIPKKSTYQFVSFVKSRNKLQNSFWNTLVETAATSRGSKAKTIPKRYQGIHRNIPSNQPQNGSAAVPIHHLDEPVSTSTIHAHPAASRLQNNPMFGYNDQTATPPDSNSNMQSEMVALRTGSTSTAEDLNQIEFNMTSRGPHRRRPVIPVANSSTDQTTSGSILNGAVHHQSSGARISNPYVSANDDQSAPIPLEIAHRSSSQPTDRGEKRKRAVEWSAEDDRVLLQARNQGVRMNQMSSDYFPGRTPKACQHRYDRLMHQRKLFSERKKFGS